MSLLMQVFERVRNECPESLGRLVGLPGDIGQECLGLSEEDEQLVVDNASVVLHLAATVQFNVPLRDSLRMNVLGTRYVMKLCKKMKKLEVCGPLTLWQWMCINNFLLSLSPSIPPSLPPSPHSSFFYAPLTPFCIPYSLHRHEGGVVSQLWCQILHQWPQLPPGGHIKVSSVSDDYQTYMYMCAVLLEFVCHQKSSNEK